MQGTKSAGVAADSPRSAHRAFMGTELLAYAMQAESLLLLCGPTPSRVCPSSHRKASPRALRVSNLTRDDVLKGANHQLRFAGSSRESNTFPSEVPPHCWLPPFPTWSAWSLTTAQRSWVEPLLGKFSRLWKTTFISLYESNLDHFHNLTLWQLLVCHQNHNFSKRQQRKAFKMNIYLHKSTLLCFSFYFLSTPLWN